jgi:hypothetical protein
MNGYNAHRTAEPPSKQRMLEEDKRRRYGGAGRDRTDDPMLAKHVLSQLSYSPTFQGYSFQGRRMLLQYPSAINHRIIEIIA